MSALKLRGYLNCGFEFQEQFYSRGLDQILAVDRKSMLDEIDDLRQQIGSLQRVLLDDNKDLTEKLNGLELRYKKRQKRLKNQRQSYLHLCMYSTSDQRRQSGLKSGGSWIRVKKIDFIEK